MTIEYTKTVYDQKIGVKPINTSRSSKTFSLVVKSIGKNFTNLSFQPKTKEGRTMASEEMIEVFANQFA